MIARGEAERMAGDPAYRLTLLEGARLARELGDVERLARAALANNRGFSGSAQGVDRERVAVLTAALDGLGGATARRARPARRARRRARRRPRLARRAELGDEALAMARRLGDPRTLARVLDARAMAQWNPRTVADRNATCSRRGGWPSGSASGCSPRTPRSSARDAAVEAGDLALADG